MVILNKNVVEGLYYLMHKDDIVAIIKQTTKGMQLLVILDEERLPIMVRQNPKKFKDWWNDRSIPRTRKGYNLEFVEKEINQVLLNTYALSLTDHYWVKPIDVEMSWCDVNLFENDFQDVFGTKTFTTFGDTEGVMTSLLSGYTTKGELQKKWLIGEDGVRYLLKGVDGNTSQQSLNEVFVTNINYLQEVECTPYYLQRFETLSGDEKWGCLCPTFTSSQYEFVSAYELYNAVDKNLNLSNYNKIVYACELGGLDRQYVEEFLSYQILLDFLVSNDDRHLNNFGVLRDTETLEYVKMAPIFDSGNCMFWNREVVPKG